MRRFMIMYDVPDDYPEMKGIQTLATELYERDWMPIHQDSGEMAIMFGTKDIRFRWSMTQLSTDSFPPEYLAGLMNKNLDLTQEAAEQNRLLGIDAAPDFPSKA
jgi:hypothetical protein